MKQLVVLSVMLFGVAAAAPQISPQSILVNPVRTDLRVQVRVDKDSSGRFEPSYRVGSPIQISTNVNHDAYVYLFSIDASGEVTQLLPNRFASGQNFIRAHSTKVFPTAADAFNFTVDGPIGMNKVIALASKTPLNLAQLSAFKSQQDQFATVSSQGQDQFARALSITVRPVPQNTWATDTVSFQVVGRSPMQTGSLFVSTDVSSALVILGGQALGSANTTLSSISPGMYSLRVQAGGFPDFVSNVRIVAGTVTRLSVNFQNFQPMPGAFQPAPIVPQPAPVVPGQLN